MGGASWAGSHSWDAAFEREENGGVDRLGGWGLNVGVRELRFKGSQALGESEQERETSQPSLVANLV